MTIRKRECQKFVVKQEKGVSFNAIESWLKENVGVWHEDWTAEVQLSFSQVHTYESYIFWILNPKHATAFAMKWAK